MTRGGDGRVSVDGTEYEVDPDLADETVILWWGLFDQDLFVEHAGKRYGPYSPSRGAIPLYRYRKYQKTKSEERIDRVMTLAQQLGLPRAAVTGEADALPLSLQRPLAVPRQPFPEPAAEPAFPSVIAAKSAIADLLRRPLAKLPEADLAFVNALVSDTLDRRAVLRQVCERFGLPLRES